MNEQEQLEFCGHVCMAARRLGIPVEWGPAHFLWHDRHTGQMVVVKNTGDKKETLFLACQALVNYLTIPPKKTA